MKFLSTRGTAPAIGLGAAIAAGLAPDGGLYVPESLPQFALRDFADCTSMAATATRLLAPFFSGDALLDDVPAICAEAFSFSASMRALATPDDHVLELFHGPTAAFKDFGARFLAACMHRLRKEDAQPLTILAATSGDTGAAVGAAFAGLDGFRVVILYPDGRVSSRQAHQLGCFGGDVRALRVAGSFDDCQNMVKQALADQALRARMPTTSANSISLGRLLPQMAYYAHAALIHWHAQNTQINFVVPTGNLGNGFAAILARACGLPIGRIALAGNANHVLADFFAGADFMPQDSVATLANAMDVGAPSNFERLRWLYPDAAQLRREFQMQSVDDAGIRSTIRNRHRLHGEIFCPHSATAVHMLESLRGRGATGNWAAVATAHPAKFEAIVEPLIGGPVVAPDSLNELLARPTRSEPLPAGYAALRGYLLENQAARS